MIRAFLVALALSVLAGCVVRPAPERVVVVGPGPVWVPGHFGYGGYWIPGHWR
jgi:hypothetical protein